MSQSEQEPLEERVAELESRISELEQLIHDEGATDDVTGMREFVQQIDPDAHTKRALAIAYYLDQYQGQENFSSKDIEEGYRTCRVQKPANMSDTVGVLEDKGWAMDDGKGDDGQTRLRRLTGDGLNAIEEVLEDGA
jgi:hypothetical protein